MERDHRDGNRGLRAESVHRWSDFVLLLPQDDIRPNKLSMPGFPCRAGVFPGNRLERAAVCGGRGHVLTRLRASRYTSVKAPACSLVVLGLREAGDVPVLRERLRERDAVLALIPHKARQMMILLLVGMAIGIGVLCQVHPPTHDHGHGMPFTGHHSSSPHASLDFFCLLAVLPPVVSFASLRLSVLHAPPLAVIHLLLVSLPFIPPRQATS